MDAHEKQGTRGVEDGGRTPEGLGRTPEGFRVWDLGGLIDSARDDMIVTTTPIPCRATFRATVAVPGVGEVRRVLAEVRRLAHQAERDMISRALAEDAAKFPVFARARRAAVVAAFEVDDVHTPPSVFFMLRVLHVYETLRGGLSTPRPAAVAAVDACLDTGDAECHPRWHAERRRRWRGWMEIYERERGR